MSPGHYQLSPDRQTAPTWEPWVRVWTWGRSSNFIFFQRTVIANSIYYINLTAPGWNATFIIGRISIHTSSIPDSLLFRDSFIDFCANTMLFWLQWVCSVYYLVGHYSFSGFGYFCTLIFFHIKSKVVFLQFPVNPTGIIIIPTY